MAPGIIRYPRYAVRLPFCSALSLLIVLLTLSVPVPGYAWEESREGEFLLARLSESLARGPVKETQSLTDRLHSLGQEWGYRADFMTARYLVEQTTRTELAENLLVQLLDRYTIIHDQVLFNLGRVLAMNGRDGPAVAVLARLHAEYPKSPLSRRAQLLIAEIRLEGRQADQALLTLVPLLSDAYRPGDNAVRFLMARAFIALHREEEALRLLRGILIHGPGTAESLLASRIIDALGGVELSFDEKLQRAHSLARFRRYDEASKEYERLLSLSPGNPEILEALGRALFSSRQYDKAGAILGKAESADSAYLEVRSLYRNGDQKAFLQRLKEVQTRYPELHRRLFALRLAKGQDLRRAGNFREAERLYTELLGVYPDERSAILWELGWSQYRRSDFGSAAGTFKKLLASADSPDIDKALYWLARSHDQLGQPKEARVALERLRGEYGHGYYAALANNGARSMLTEPEPPAGFPRIPEDGPLRRIEELRLVGLLAEARTELALAASQMESMEDAQAFGYLAAGVEDFARAMQVAEPLSRFKPELRYIAYPRGYWSHIEAASTQEGIDPYLVASVIRRESRFNPRAYSSAGAMGLMQLMPATARRAATSTGVPLEGESTLFEPDTNIRIGTHHLAELIRQYGQNIILAVAAYNAGRSAVAKWLERKDPVPPDEFVEEISYPETQNYVKHVIKNYIHYRELWGLTPPTLSAMVGSSEPAKL